MIELAVIGTGWITETMIGGTLKICPERMRLSAVYSRTEEKAASFIEGLRKSGAILQDQPVRIFTDLDALAADGQIDAVYVASPNSFHYPQCRKMLLAGKHVLAEKPIVLKETELSELIQISREKGLVFLEAIMMLHQPQLPLLKKALEKIGRIHTAHIDFSQLSSKYPAYLAGQLPNIFNPRFGTGALEDLGIYCMYFVMELFGVPESSAIRSRFLPSGADHSGEVLLSYPELDVTISYSKVGQSRQGSQIIGDEGTLVVDSISQLTGMRVYAKDGSCTEIYGDDDKWTLMGREARTFAQLIDHELPEETASQLQDKALAVCRLMETLRTQAGIVFTMEEG